MDLRLAALCAAFSTAFCACAGAPRAPFAPEAPPPGLAAVYFYQPPEMTASLRKPKLYVNGAELGRLPNGSYALAYLPPGQIEVRSKWSGLPGAGRDDEASLTLEAGKTYYLRVRFHTGKPHHLLTGGALQLEDRPGLEEVPEPSAVPQLDGLARAAGLSSPAR